MSEKPNQFNNLLWEQDGAVLVLTLNRPDQMNAISPELNKELRSALASAEKDPSIRAIVLTGSGKAFCAGYDLGEDEDPRGGRARDALRNWWDVDMKTPGDHLGIMRLEKPVIAAVNGWCLGGGMWYALCCDITIASERAVFGQPEVREIQNSTFLLAALAGWKVAHRYALTGDHFDAAEALRIGVVNEVVPAEELLTTAVGLARRIALLPPDAVRINKAITTYGLEAMGLRVALDTSALLAVIAHASVDAPDLDELYRIRESEGLRASLAYRDDPFLPEPGGPRSKPRGG
jgi:enoyl-CoA hydratase/carnithine racemase